MINNEKVQKAIDRLKAFGRMLKAREAAGLDNSIGWNTPEAVMMWWVGDNPLQMSFVTPEYLK